MYYDREENMFSIAANHCVTLSSDLSKFRKKNEHFINN